MIPPPDHIPDERLVDLIEGRLPAVERPGVQEHLGGCPACADSLARLGSIVALVRAEALEDAPPAVQARAVQLLANRPRAVVASMPRRILAALGFDSASRPLAFGVRAEASARQVFFLAEGYDLDLRIASVGQLWSLEGQVLGPASSGTALLLGAGSPLQVALNEQGEFSLRAVPEGLYRLVVNIGDVEIEVPDLQVGNAV